MIFIGSILFCVDNTDIKKVKCINFFSNCCVKNSKLGYVIKTVVFKRDVKKSKHIKNFLNLHLVTALVNKFRRLNGNFIRFDTNRCVTISAESKFLGSRIFGGICKEIRSTNINIFLYKKILSYAIGIL